MIRIMIGLLIAFGAVGGIEHSQTDLDLFYAALTASFGLMLMASGLAFVKE